MVGALQRAPFEQLHQLSAEVGGGPEPGQRFCQGQGAGRPLPQSWAISIRQAGRSVHRIQTPPERAPGAAAADSTSQRKRTGCPQVQQAAGDPSPSLSSSAVGSPEAAPATQPRSRCSSAHDPAHPIELPPAPSPARRARAASGNSGRFGGWALFRRAAGAGGWAATRAVRQHPLARHPIELEAATGRQERESPAQFAFPAAGACRRAGRGSAGRSGSGGVPGR